MRSAITAWAASMAVICTVTACHRDTGGTENAVPVSNEQIRKHAFLQCMYDDAYFPKHLVDKGKQILLRLCARIEQEKPADEAALYVLTHAATDDFNRLAEEFFDADSEIETGARECCLHRQSLWLRER
jgi:Family of unknown function (DUF5713)